MLRSTIKIAAVLLAVAGVFVYAMLNRQLGALQLRQAIPPLGETFERLFDARDALPEYGDLNIVGQREADSTVDPSHA